MYVSHKYPLLLSTSLLNTGVVFSKLAEYISLRLKRSYDRDLSLNWTTQRPIVTTTCADGEVQETL